MTQETIQSLTPEQEAQLPVYRDKWIEIGLQTGPMNQDAAREAIKLVYEKGRLTPPKEVFFLQSPKHAVEFIQQYAKERHNLDMDKNEILNEMIYGCHDAGWLGFYEFFKDECGIAECSDIDGLAALAKAGCGWANVYDDVAFLQDPPVSIKFDDQDRLHSETGPAIEYSDGYAVYAWHGVRVPSEWILKPESLDAKTALTWENIEERRCACEIVGWARILKELDAKTIDEDVDPTIGTLVEVDLPDIGRERFLRVLCGTGREFALPVPPDVNTALAANEWTYDLEPGELRGLEVRT